MTKPPASTLSPLFSVINNPSVTICRDSCLGKIYVSFLEKCKNGQGWHEWAGRLQTQESFSSHSNHRIRHDAVKE